MRDQKILFKKWAGRGYITAHRTGTGTALDSHFNLYLFSSDFVQLRLRGLLLFKMRLE